MAGQVSTPLLTGSPPPPDGAPTPGSLEELQPSWISSLVAAGALLNAQFPLTSASPVFSPLP